MRKHYHVITGLQGCYMPDNNSIAASKREALSIARYEARQWNDGASDDDLMKQRASGVYVSRHSWIHISSACTDECYDNDAN